MVLVSDIKESIRLAKHYNDGAQHAAEVPDNRAGYVKLNLQVIVYAEQALAQIHLAAEVLAVSGLRGMMPAIHALRGEASELTRVAQQNIVDSL